jgi:hypothetical protein
MDEIANQEQIYNTTVDNYNARLQTYNNLDGPSRQTEYEHIQNEYQAVRQAYGDFTFF